MKSNEIQTGVTATPKSRKGGETASAANPARITKGKKKTQPADQFVRTGKRGRKHGGDDRSTTVPEFDPGIFKMLDMIEEKVKNGELPPSVGQKAQETRELLQGRGGELTPSLVDEKFRELKKLFHTAVTAVMSTMANKTAQASPSGANSYTLNPDQMREMRQFGERIRKELTSGIADHMAALIASGKMTPEQYIKNRTVIPSSIVPYSMRYFFNQ